VLFADEAGVFNDFKDDVVDVLVGMGGLASGLVFFCGEGDTPLLCR
jgi:hypothetical protein